MNRIVLKDIADEKIKSIKILRTYTGIGVAEGKDLVEMVERGEYIGIVSVPKEKVDVILKEFDDIGASAVYDDYTIFTFKDISYNVTESYSAYDSTVSIEINKDSGNNAPNSYKSTDSANHFKDKILNLFRLRK